MKTLSAKQKLFVAEYLKDLNQAQAAVRCGYKESNARVTGMRMMKNPQVAALVAESIKARSERTQIDADYVLMVTKETVERCRQTISPILDKKGVQVLTEDRNGNLVPAFEFNAMGVLKGVELLGRHVGMWKDKLVHQNPDGSNLSGPVINIGFGNGGPGEPSTSAKGS